MLFYSSHAINFYDFGLGFFLFQKRYNGHENILNYNALNIHTRVVSN